MTIARLPALVKPDQEGGMRICSPTVGIIDFLPEKGTLINGSATVAILKRYGISYQIYLPEEASGFVVKYRNTGSHIAADYGDLLLELVPFQEGALKSAGKESEGKAEANHEGSYSIKSPSHGIFYSSSSPEADPFVKAGDKVRKGDILCLVEVMKCFYQVVYQGDDLPETGVIQSILPANESEVKSGQRLFEVTPVVAP